MGSRQHSATTLATLLSYLYGLLLTLFLLWSNVLPCRSSEGVEDKERRKGIPNCVLEEVACQRKRPNLS